MEDRRNSDVSTPHAAPCFPTCGYTKSSVRNGPRMAMQSPNGSTGQRVVRAAWREGQPLRAESIAITGRSRFEIPQPQPQLHLGAITSSGGLRITRMTARVAPTTACRRGRGGCDYEGIPYVEMYGISCCETVFETALNPPSTTMLFGCNRVNSA